MTTQESIVARLRFGVCFFITALLFMSAFVNIRTADARSCDPCPTVASDDLNLRSGPSTTKSILWVIPKGTEVIAANSTTNGFSKVTVNGREGWAYRQYLVSPDTPAVIGTMMTVDYLNLRKAPGTTEAIIEVMPPLASVEATGQTVNGFRYVYFNGLPGWAFDDYLANGTHMTTTTDLNLRSKASTSSKVLKVMPPGASVTLTGDESNGFVAVSYQGVKGWAFRDYLR
jgi:mannosyl-glycoprotein endo-beta-N-acetylglucosaminidase